MPPPYFSDHGLREVMGTTYTPSDLRYAKEVIPRITQRTDGGRAFPSAMKNFCKRTRFFAASSIILAPNFISNVPISRRKVRSTQVFPHHLGPSTHTAPKESSMNFRRVSAIRGISQKEHHRLHGKMRGFTSHNQMSYRTLTHMNKHGPDVCFTDTVRTKIFRSICSCHLIWTADGSRPSVVAHISCAGMIPWKRKWKTGKRPWSHWPLSPQWHFAPQVSS